MLCLLSMTRGFLGVAAMKFEIRRAKNGWIVENIDPEDPSEVVGVEEDDEHEAFANFLREVSYHFGPTDSKYSSKRLRVVILPGTDYCGTLDEDYRQELLDLRDYIDCALNPEK
jgi:hypothetical protein